MLKKPRKSKKSSHTLKKKTTKKRFRSNFEATIWDRLIKSLSHFEPGYEDFKFDYVLLRSYTPDFSFRDPKTKEIFFIEAKGRFPGSDRTKLLEVVKQNPGVDIRLLFMQDNWISSNKKARYSDWAKKHNFKYSVWPKLPL